jgi:hypothetical protein
MLSVMSWVCDCGSHVKVMNDTGGVATVRCPNPQCNNQRAIPGKRSDLWVEDAEHIWTRMRSSGC